MITPDDKDYITILNTLTTKKLVVVMHYMKGTDEYIQTRCSQPTDPQTAQRIAENWAAASKMDIR
jgi:hypothetical protein